MLCAVLHWARWWQILSLTLGMGLAIVGAEPLAAQSDVVVVVCPPAWSSALESWKLHRQRQGVEVVELDAGSGADELRASIRQVAEASRVKWVMLAGEVKAPAAVPTFYHDSTALVQLGGTPRLASDNDYGDLDDDGLPDLGVGRVPARSARQLRDYLARVIQYESSEDFSTWRRDVHVVAGVGGFGAMADSLIEMTSRHFLTDRLPAWVNLSMTQANLNSHYCPDPLVFSQTCLDRLNAGGLFWIYMGHGFVDRLDSFRLGDQAHPIMTSNHLPSVDIQYPPIAVFLACYTGALDAGEESLAQQLVLKPTGPIAAIAASRVSAPYGLAVLSDGLLQGCYFEQLPTLGEIFLSAKRGMLDEGSFTTGSDAPNQRATMQSLARLMSPKGYDLRAERLEHVWQMNLLGDPLMRIHHPQPLEFAPHSDQLQPGQAVSLTGVSPQAGRLSIELAQRRGQTGNGSRRSKMDWTSEAGRAEYAGRYAAANRLVLSSSTQQVEAGNFAVDLLLPAGLDSGRYAVRLFLEGQSGWMVGYQEVTVTAP